MAEQVEQILFGSATAATEMLGGGQISSRELTRLALARIDAVNPSLNAVVELRREAALREAAAADEAIARGELTGPLHGVPVTVKEAIQVAGMRSTWGNPAFKDFVADSDATVVQRLRRAGAIVVGTSNVAFMLADFAQTANQLYGVTNNPWDIARTPGGSSGGAAAAIAAGLSFLDYGSDLVAPSGSRPASVAFTG
jgi:amidase